MLKRLYEIISKNKYVLIILVLGVILLLLPSASEKNKNEENTDTYTEDSKTAEFSLEYTEERLQNILSKIEGAGDVSVFLSVKSDGERLLASDSDIQENSTEENSGNETSYKENTSTVILKKDGDDTVVTLKYIYPDYLGAVVVAQGADSSRVKLDIVEAVQAATGLSADKIKVIKMK